VNYTITRNTNCPDSRSPNRCRALSRSMNSPVNPVSTRQNSYHQLCIFGSWILLPCFASHGPCSSSGTLSVCVSRCWTWTPPGWIPTTTLRPVCKCSRCLILLLRSITGTPALLTARSTYSPPDCTPILNSVCPFRRTLRTHKSSLCIQLLQTRIEEYSAPLSPSIPT
jgi:hypothetical protein